RGGCPVGCASRSKTTCPRRSSVDGVVDWSRRVVVRTDHPPQGIGFERGDGLQPFANEPPDQGALRDTLPPRRLVEGRGKVLLYQDLQALHRKDDTPPRPRMHNSAGQRHPPVAATLSGCPRRSRTRNVL